MEQPLSPVSQFASYDKLNPYANPGDLEPVNIVSFAYQIASGMVRLKHYVMLSYLTMMLKLYILMLWYWLSCHTVLSKKGLTTVR